MAKKIDVKGANALVKLCDEAMEFLSFEQDMPKWYQFGKIRKMSNHLGCKMSARRWFWLKLYVGCYLPVSLFSILLQELGVLPVTDGFYKQLIFVFSRHLLTFPIAVFAGNTILHWRGLKGYMECRNLPSGEDLNKLYSENPKGLLAKYLEAKFGKMRDEMLGGNSSLLKLKTRIAAMLHSARALAEKGKVAMSQVDDQVRSARFERLQVEADEAVGRLEQVQTKLDRHLAKIDAFLKCSEESARREFAGSWDELSYAREIRELTGESSQAVEEVEVAVTSSVQALHTKIEELRHQVLPALTDSAEKIFAQGNAKDFDYDLEIFDLMLEKADRVLPEPKKVLT